MSCRRVCPNCENDFPLENLVGILKRHSLPQPNDVALCLFCGQISLFTDELELRKPTDVEWELLQDSLVMRVLRRAQQRALELARRHVVN